MKNWPRGRCETRRQRPFTHQMPKHKIPAWFHRFHGIYFAIGVAPLPLICSISNTTKKKKKYYFYTNRILTHKSSDFLQRKMQTCSIANRIWFSPNSFHFMLMPHLIITSVASIDMPHMAMTLSRIIFKCTLGREKWGKKCPCRSGTRKKKLGTQRKDSKDEWTRKMTIQQIHSNAVDGFLFFFFHLNGSTLINNFFFVRSTCRVHTRRSLSSHIILYIVWVLSRLHQPHSRSI